MNTLELTTKTMKAVAEAECANLAKDLTQAFGVVHERVNILFRNQIRMEARIEALAEILCATPEMREQLVEATESHFKKIMEKANAPKPATLTQ